MTFIDRKVVICEIFEHKIQEVIIDDRFSDSPQFGLNRCTNNGSTSTLKAWLSKIVIALDGMHSSAVLSFFYFFIVNSQVELARVTRERDQWASAQTAPQQAGFGSD